MLIVNSDNCSQYIHMDQRRRMNLANRAFTWVLAVIIYLKGDIYMLNFK